MAELSLLTYNVRGLRNPKKREKVFSFMKSHKCEVLCLQETHGDATSDFSWTREMGTYNCTWNNNTSRRGGTAILVKNDNNFVVANTKKLHEGRTTIVEIRNDDDKDLNKMVIVNVYAPANSIQERLRYFENLDRDLEIYFQNVKDNHELIITGDFNCVLEQWDKSKPFCLAKEQSSQFLRSIMSKYGLNDAWRKLNGNKQQYTWRQLDKTNENRNTACRLDRWLVKNTLIGNVAKCKIVPSILSDHLPVILKLQSLADIKKGRGVWKLNNTLLKDKTFNENIRDMWNDHKSIKPNLGEDLLDWWDAGKSKVKKIAIQRRSIIKKHKNVVYNNLMAELQNLLNQYDMNPCCDLSQRIDQYKKLIENIENERLEGTKVRSRVKWFEEGERPTKYFLNVEASKGKSKTWTSIRKQDGNLSNKIEEILETQVDFYSNLYKEGPTDQKCQQTLLDNITANLSEEARNKCEGLITLEEMDQALKSFENNKTPGGDGLSKEFYQNFWWMLSEDLLDVLNCAYDIGHLSDSQQEAILTLLYKNGEKEDIKNWRPISLLSMDYKILTKCLSNRIRRVMKEIISKDQTCSVPGRSIYENIIFTQDAIFYANKYNKPLVIVSLDQSKAFDRVNRGFIIKCLTKFGFGENLVKWVKTIYARTRSRICTNGFLSETFDLTRGVRQGCPLSPLLYIIVAETLSILIKKNEKIKGFRLPDNTESKIKAYADDTNTYLRDIESVKELFKSLEIYSKATEAKLNQEKTKIILCGTLQDKENELENWKIEDTLKILGVWVGNRDTSEENWNPILVKVRKVLNFWCMRDLTIYGRVQIVKTLALAKLWYVATVSIPPTRIIQDIIREVWNFIWNKKRHAVSKEQCLRPLEEGGLGMIDIEKKCKCLRMKWLTQIMDGTENSDAIRLGYFFVENFDKSFNSVQVITTVLKNVRNENVPALYVEMLDTWKNLGLQRISPNSKDTVLEEFLWLNPQIKYNNETLYNPTWIQTGFLKVKDIWNEDSKSWLESNDIIRRFPRFFQTNPRSILEMYRKLLYCLSMKQWPELLKRNEVNINTPRNYLQIWYGKKMKELKCQVLYKTLMLKKEQTHPVGDRNIWWSTLYKSDLDRKTKELMWKIYHDGLALGDKLKIWFDNENGMCLFCKNAEENTLHLFKQCPIVTNFWGWVCTHFNIPFQELNDDGIKVNFLYTDKGNFYILAICKKVIWDLRNSVKFKDIDVDIQGFKLNFKLKLKSHLQTLMMVYEKKGDVPTFLEVYGSNDIIKIENKKILLN